MKLNILLFCIIMINLSSADSELISLMIAQDEDYLENEKIK